jgi:hypothetical protein
VLPARGGGNASSHIIPRPLAPAGRPDLAATQLQFYFSVAGLSFTGLSFTGLSFTGLSFTGLSFTGLPSPARSRLGLFTHRQLTHRG